MSENFDWSSLYTEIDYSDDPIKLNSAEVVRGFQRGSKELGCPTANLNMDQLSKEHNSLQTGIYYGYAYLRGDYHPAVVSVGWNPFYKNEKKTIEAHLLGDHEDFYGEEIQVTLYGYLRDECSFNSLGE